MTTHARYPFVRGEALYFKHPQGAVVKDANGSYLIKGDTVYAWLTALTQLMNGSQSVDDITSQVPQGTQSTAEQLIELLVSRGTARLLEGPLKDAETSALNEIEAFLSNWSATPRTDARRFTQTPIAVVGDDHIAQAFLDNLKTNGAQQAVMIHNVEDLQRSMWEWVFVTTASPLSTVHTLSQAAASGAFRLLCVFTLDQKVITGPIIDQNGPVESLENFADLLLRNASATAHIAWREYAMRGRPLPTHLSPAVAEIVGVNAAFEVFREITGALPSQLQQAALVMDERTVDSSLERVIDPFSPPRANVAPALSRPNQQRSTPHARSDQEVLDDLLALMSPNTGIFADFDDDHYLQEPLFVARIRHGWNHPALPRAGMGFSTESFAEARRDALLSALSACAATVAEAQQGHRLAPQSYISSAFGVEEAARQAQWMAIEHELFHRAMRSAAVAKVDAPLDDPIDQLLWNHLNHNGQTVTLLYWHTLPAPLVVGVITDSAGQYRHSTRAAAPTVAQAVTTVFARLAAGTQFGLEPTATESWFELDPQRLLKPSTSAAPVREPVDLASVMTELNLCPQLCDITPDTVSRMTTARTVYLQWENTANE
ncbi:hypothetical protein [Auritidibacter sp. NML100628]|uniref:hypothetical protein n=1 Tax=Auritidibacter sp. NML100628 TaxID=2170742 RepID=UPI000D738872|nr:hypothetical protein [Auritidibacter sp. NML100628]PXA77057.1 hypothetical protein DCC24_05535 [Auritidibacter sp. NML100628]